MDSIELLDDLIARVEEMLPEIDLERDMSQETARIIAEAEMSGTPVGQRTKKLHVLVQLGRISNAEYMRVVFEEWDDKVVSTDLPNGATVVRAKNKPAARLAGSVKTDKKNIPIEQLSFPSGQPEPLDDLVARVNSMISEIDLERDMSQETVCLIAETEMSGTRMSEKAKRLFVLMQLGHISRDEYRRIVLERAYRWL